MVMNMNIKDSWYQERQMGKDLLYYLTGANIMQDSLKMITSMEKDI